MKTGKVIQVIGAAVDIQFSPEHLPAIENAIEIEMEGNHKIVAEVAQQMGDGIVRCVALESTDGLQRGAVATDTGASLQVPVGEACLGRLLNVLGKPQDHKGDIKAKMQLPIHRQAPSLTDQNPTPEIFETGIKYWKFSSDTYNTSGVEPQKQSTRQGCRTQTNSRRNELW